MFNSNNQSKFSKCVVCGSRDDITTDRLVFEETKSAGRRSYYVRKRFSEPFPICNSCSEKYKKFKDLQPLFDILKVIGGLSTIVSLIYLIAPYAMDLLYLILHRTLHEMPYQYYGGVLIASLALILGIFLYAGYLIPTRTSPKSLRSRVKEKRRKLYVKPIGTESWIRFDDWVKSINMNEY